MSIQKLVDFRISVENWDVVLTKAQARQAISEKNEAQVWEKIYDKIIADKQILDSLLKDYRNGSYTQCPLHTIVFPNELIDALNELLP